jgi:lipoprotein-anchoring transpeptidase ErfK/SrfK
LITGLSRALTTRLTQALARHRRVAAAVIGSSAACLIVAGLLVASGLGGGRARPPARSPGTATTQSAAGVTTLATVRFSSPRYTSPGQRGRGQIPATWFGYRSVLPVIAASPGWVEVRLAQRPDGSTAWLPASDVMLSTTPYRIVIDLGTTHLSLYRDGHRVFTAPAGVGATDDPTPPGQYFVAFIEPPPQPNPGYGAFILVTSDHSRTILNWEGSGDALIGIHGPLGSNRQIGLTGARISHGCIRLHERALVKLRDVPAGTPITILG